MTARIAILVEGATEKAFKPTLLGFLETRLQGRMPKLRIVKWDGRIPMGDELKEWVNSALSTSAAVIALTDVYTGSNPKVFIDAADAKRKMKQWVGLDEHRFYPHAAQHDFEAWLLPYWSRIQTLARSNRRSPSPHPENVNHDRPPARVLRETFENGSSKRSYSKVRDGMAILKGGDLTVAADACPELKAFLNTILTLAGGDRLD